MPSNKTRGCLWACGGCLVAVVLLWLAGAAVLRFAFHPYRQMSDSMAPTLAKGDVVLTRPVREVKHGDLIVFTYDGKAHMKRVIGEPGDIVQLKDNQLFLNGQKIEEPYVMLTPDIPAIRNTPEIKVAPGNYFVLGDNRDNSLDSRFIGTIKRDDIRARIVLVLSKKNGAWRP